MANAFFNGFRAKIMDGSIDLDTDTIKIALMASGYAVDIDAHTAWSNISASEASLSAGYVAGGQALTTKAVTQDNTNDRGVFDADDPSWTGIGTATCEGAVIYKDSGTPATSWLIAHIDTVTSATFPVQLTGGDYTIQFAASSAGGVFYND